MHLDVVSAFSPSASPSTPETYVRTLARQFPINERTARHQQTPAIALADTNLSSAVKMAVACAREGIEHIVGLRVRVVAERAYRGWGERPGELILLAVDEVGWLNLGVTRNLRF